MSEQTPNLPDTQKKVLRPFGGALSTGVGTINDPLVKAMSAALKSTGTRSAIYDAFSRLPGEQILAWPYGVDPQELAILGDEDPTHSACCTIKSVAVARAGFRFSYGDEDAGKKVPTALRDEFEELHGELGASELMYRCEKDFWNLGNSWVEVVRSASNKIVAINHIPGFTMFRLAPTADKQSGDYVQEVEGVRVYFRAFGSDPANYKPDSAGRAPNEVVHMMDYSSSHAMYGVVCVWPALHAVLVNRLIGLNNIEFYEDKGVARYILVMDGAYQVEDEDVSTLTHYINGLLERQGNKLVLFGTPGEVKSQMHKLRDEFDFGDQNVLRNANRDEICRAHSTPPRIVGIISAGSLGGTSEGEVQFDEFKALAVRPRQEVWRKLYHRLFFSQVAKRSKWGVRFNEIDFADVLRLAQARNMQLRNGTLTINEARAADGRSGMGPVGDRHFIASGGQPIAVEDIGKQPETPPVVGGQQDEV